MLYVALHEGNNAFVLRLATPVTAIHRFYTLLLGFFAGGVLVSLLVAAALAYRLSRQQARPLEQLSALTAEIAHGNYKAPVPQLAEPEFQHLAQGLAELAKDLDNSVNALRDGNNRLTTVLSSITEGLVALDGEGRLLFINATAVRMLELDDSDTLIGCASEHVLRHRALSDLASQCIRERKGGSVEINVPSPAPQLLQASASPMQGVPGCLLLLVDVTQLRKLEHIRRDFVANVTHELRTPLTSIRGYVETLQSGAVNSPELSAKFLQIIEIEAERLGNLIGDLLLLSEIENNNQDTGIRRFRLRDVADSVTEMLQFTAAARNITVACDVDEDIHLRANPDRIKQLLLNLADNAVKYNVDGGSVTISAERSAGLVRIRVKDTGIGISEEHVSRIFERFYRVDKGRSRSMGGTGLGLSITKHIVDLYKGNIRLISEPGHGSEFIIELPQTGHKGKE
jgi:two-component system phosphate regulon sensor histidine kinase PhoR